MKKRIWLDSILGTFFIFFLIWLIYNVSALGIFDLFDPIGEALADMEFTDVVFSQLRDEPEVDPNVVLVNIGYLSRAEIAMQLNILDQYDPKVIGIDAFFGSLKEDTLGDMMLSDAIRNAGNVVLVSELVDQSFDRSTKTWDSLRLSHELFSQPAAGHAFANLITDNDAGIQEDFKVTRSFLPITYIKGIRKQREMAFGVKLAELYSPEKTERFLKRNNESEIINYRGNIINPYQKTVFGGKFFALDWEEVISENFDPSILKDKILIMGFLGSDFLDPSWHDRFYTPMNPKYAGRANPDMFGAVIHANIASMIINENYIYQWPEWLEAVIAIILTFANIYFFSLIYRRIPKWYDGTTKVIQLMEILIFLFLIIMMFHWFDLKLNLTLLFAGIALAGDGLEVFYGLIMNSFSKEGRAQLFRVDKEY